MADAFIIDAIRTPIGKKNGKLRDWHPADLLARLFEEIVKRNDLDPHYIDDVMVGCVSQVWDQALSIARTAVLAAGFPFEVPAVTINRACGSSQQAVDFAAQTILGGINDLVLAGGVEHMTRVPLEAPRLQGDPYPSRVRKDYEMVHQGISGELIAERWDLSREELDAYAYESQMRATRATNQRFFSREIIPLEVGSDQDQHETMSTDQGIRPDTTMETLATLKPAFKEGGRHTAGNSSQISDGAAAILVGSAKRAEELGLRPRARFVAFAVAGVDPTIMLTGPIPATVSVLKRAGMSLDDIDVIEVNEAFASVVLAWERELHADMSRVNRNGGAIALGHPPGMTGARLYTTALHELERIGGRYGLVTMCEGDGLANATIMERV